jgi:hypothetical protein
MCDATEDAEAVCARVVKAAIAAVVAKNSS